MLSRQNAQYFFNVLRRSIEYRIQAIGKTGNEFNRSPEQTIAGNPTIDRTLELIARHTLVAVFARTLYCSSNRSASASLGILKRVIRSIGAIVAVVDENRVIFGETWRIRAGDMWARWDRDGRRGIGRDL